MTYIDAHCHLADPRFDGIRQEVLTRARQAGISGFMQGGVDPDDWQRQETLNDGSWFTCFGLHPWFVAASDESACAAAFGQLKQQLGGAVALGELGLDKGPRCDPGSYDRQEKWFTAQLQLAAERDLPLVLHVVRAHGPVLAILNRQTRQWRGMVHGFTGSAEVARAYLELGLCLSIGGAVVRSGYKKLKQAVASIPFERILVESDAPDMAPDAYDRPHNEPESLLLVAQRIGELTHRSADAVLATGSENVRRIFDLELTP